MDSVRIRCPKCSKPYSVKRVHLAVTNPAFKCVQCQTQFFVQTPVPPTLEEAKCSLSKFGDEPRSGQVEPTPSSTQNRTASSSAPVQPQPSKVIGSSDLKIGASIEIGSQNPGIHAPPDFGTSDFGFMREEDRAQKTGADAAPDQMSNNEVRPQFGAQEDAADQRAFGAERSSGNMSDSMELKSSNEASPLVLNAKDSSANGERAFGNDKKIKEGSSPTQGAVGSNITGDKVRTFPCPVCKVENPKGALDCGACGIVFSKVKSIKSQSSASASGGTGANPGASAAKSGAPPNLSQSVKTGIGGSNVSSGLNSHSGLGSNKSAARLELVSGVGAPGATSVAQGVSASLELRNSWDSVLQNYEDPTAHEKFLQMALATKDLRYASQQYRNMFEANPQDEIAKKMRDKIIGLATMTFTPPRREEAQSFRLGISGLIAAAGLLVTILGFVLPGFPKIVSGIGAAFAVIGVIIRVINRKK